MYQLALAVCGSQTTDTDKIPARVGVFFVYAFVFFYPFGFLGVSTSLSMTSSVHHRAVHRN
jgi:hypothetical protein